MAMIENVTAGGTGTGDPRLDRLARMIREEAEKLIATLPDALARQWTQSPVPKPREDTPQRSSGDRPSDPTADAVLDARRLDVRATVVRSERVLRDSAVALVGVRRALEEAVARFDGEEVSCSRP